MALDGVDIRLFGEIKKILERIAEALEKLADAQNNSQNR